MEESFIQKVTKETLERLQAERGGDKEVLLIFMGGDREVDTSLEAVANLARQGIVFSAYLTSAAERLIGKERVLGAGVKRIIGEYELWDRNILQKIDGIIVPVLTLNGASKLAHMIADNAVTSIILLAFRQKKKILIASDSVICCAGPEPSIASVYMKKVNEILNIIRGLGATVIPAKSLAREGAHLFSSGNPGGNVAQTVNTTVSSAPSAPCGGDNETCIECGLCVVHREDAVRNIVNAGADRISSKQAGGKVSSDLAKLIDHTLLNADSTIEDIKKLCDEARKYAFATVCVNPSNVNLARQFLKGSDVGVTTVIGFPLGATTPTVKAIEARDALANGADEIDMVLNVGALKSGNFRLVEDDIRAVREASKGKVLKVILETALLNSEQIKKASEIAKRAGADFVKTSTGFGPGGAKAEDVKIMRETVGPSMGVKASGGIRSEEDARGMVEAGASRIGASASVAIVSGGKSDSQY